MIERDFHDTRKSQANNALLLAHVECWDIIFKYTRTHTHEYIQINLYVNKHIYIHIYTVIHLAQIHLKKT